MASISVIIPTHKRPHVLRECLRHLESQTAREQIEVIVVSDGPDAAANAVCAVTDWKMPVRYAEIPKRQQGTARNAGLQLARAPNVLFIGDDIFLDAHACEVHVRTHERLKGHAVLGHTTWHPGVGVTPVMEWLEQSGWQFGYPLLKEHEGRFIPESEQHRFTYTSHISLPTRLAKKHHFREDMLLYGWEDVEWGNRLRASGIRVFYEPDAKALHHHRIAMEDSLQRMETLGKSAMLASRQTQEFDRLPTGWKRLAYEAAALLPTTAGRHRKAFLRGIRSAR